ncbi:hypothetical protein Tco_0981344, partial [Tanacetum coccineum]
FARTVVLLAVSSDTRQLIHHHGVQVNKRNGSMVPEVDSLELSHAYGDKSIYKSVLRKVAQIRKRDDTVATDHVDVYTTEGDESINLKLVGLEANHDEMLCNFHHQFTIVFTNSYKNFYFYSIRSMVKKLLLERCVELE